MNIPARITSTTAILSLVFGIICWFALPIIGAIVAIVCGHSARAEIRRAPPGTVEGDGLAAAGLILGYCHLALIAMVILVVFGIFGGLAFFSHWHF
jgi:hypothetical protein